MEGPAKSLVPIHYSRNEGLFSVEANSANVAPFVFPTVLRSHDGNLWMPLRKQIAVVDPKVLREKPSPPPVIITRVAMDNGTIAEYGEMGQSKSVVNLKTLNKPLQFPPGRRKIEFEFTALNFSTPENVRFRYRLVGYDDVWLPPENRTAIYSGLGRGNYQFRVQASTGNGMWNEAPTSIAFEVLPFFWETWWFQVCVVVLFTTAVIALARYISIRRLHMKLRLVEQQAALDKERTRIARDLHDDLGASLTKASLTLDLTNRQIATVAEANGKLQNCSAMVRQIAMSVDEIVWAINPRNDTLRYLVDYTSQFTVEFLHAAQIKCRVDLPDNIPDVAVSPEVRHNVFLVVKEALNNVTRHARAGEVRLTIAVSEREMTVELNDNGCGFQGEPDNASADGLRNMRQRMEELGGRFELQSKPGMGTRLAFYCPLRNAQPK
jgi:signal transduction histidine kinase